ncbi:MAG TPA: hypothetical protein VKD04_03125 [Burkholderiales bacterium]|nr:hypothetical protein [Burkholderiales bacterium]
MLKKIGFLPGLFACILASGCMPNALAGDVKLVSDTWDSVCRVEITWGPNAPDGAPLEHYSDVPKNWSITKPDKLCYRRASAPDNCDSGMTQWNTRWSCATGTASGIEVFSLR